MKLFYFFMLFFCIHNQTQTSALFFEESEKSAAINPRPPVLEVSKREALRKEASKLIERIRSIEKQLIEKRIHCGNIESSFSDMELAQLSQESKRAYLPCILTITELEKELASLRVQHAAIVALLR